ncbi:MAG: ATP-binding protein [Rhodospirillales bacterium]|mgnify:CR=1 FL=1|nr:ATP-binding protein [Rhodospirillales bacterium]
MVKIKQYLPRSLLGRSLLIIVTPLVLLQLVSAFVFYENHWNKVSQRLARGLAGDIAAVIELMRRNPSAEARGGILDLAATTMAMRGSFDKGKILANAPEPQSGGIVDRMLIQAMREAVKKPFKVDSDSMDRHVVISVQLSGGVLHIVTNRKRLFSSTTYIFVLWMVGTAMILFGVATIFMRNQVRPIRRLAAAADNFGKGRDAPSFKPEGAAEVRRAAAAFISMRDRIRLQIGQRTDMLAGVSHDLRTPLTRLKLQLEMLGDAGAVSDMKGDISEMEHMLEAYLAFARGEGDETPRPTNLSAMLGEVAVQARRNGAVIDLHTEGEIIVPVRPNAFRRCLTNIVENADRYGQHVSIRAGRRGDAIEITVDDDGPGIAIDAREDAFKPFFRIDESRNPETGGVGLGLTIARDVIRGHGGEIDLDASPAGGLRARLTLPI